MKRANVDLSWLDIGKKVWCDRFGLGVVIEIVGEGEAQGIAAVFPFVGTKRLLTYYVKILPCAPTDTDIKRQAQDGELCDFEAEVDILPDLEGSEKQVSWARKLRQDRWKSIEAYLQDTPFLRDEVINNAVRSMFAETSAGAWIAEREESVHGLLTAAIGSAYIRLIRAAGAQSGEPVQATSEDSKVTLRLV